MLSINTNLSSIIAQNSMKTSTDKLNQAIERMTTGFKINHAKDNAANYSISTDMTTKIGAYQVAEDNCAQGLDMITTASESLSLIQDKLERLRALATQASNGTYGAQSKQAINQEANAIVDEINRIYSTAEYNGIKLFNQEVQMPDDPNIPKPQYDGFIKEVVRRDTSAMTKLSSVDGTVALVDGTYSISTPEELKKLADMTNAGLVSSGDEFVLANDIDLSQYENWTPIGNAERINGNVISEKFKGGFDGNGWTISGININEKNKEFRALFGALDGANIKNLGIENSSIIGQKYVAPLASLCTNTIIDNCYSKNNLLNAKSNAGGVVNDIYGGSSVLKNCYSEGVTSQTCGVGGIASFLSGGTIEKCCSNLSNGYWGSGIVLTTHSGEILNCFVTGYNNSYATVFTALDSSSNLSVLIKDCYYSEFYDSEHVDWVLRNNNLTMTVNFQNITPLALDKGDVSLQVGVSSSDSSFINLDMTYFLTGLDMFRSSSYDDLDKLEWIDKLLIDISEKQTEFGAVQNRLESAFDEINIKYENLVSSRSTLRDADIAKVSSTYIQQQILQQASATLMATANQSPAIALQLI